MEKIKASELLKQLVYNSQVAMIGEDKRLISSLNDCYGKYEKINNNTPVTIGMLAEVLKIKEENSRFIIIKTLLQVLVDNKLIENDIDFMNDSIFNKLLIDVARAAYDDCNNK